MRLLLLGGTRFLGRHVVDAALARDHEVTLFTRGRTPQPFGDRLRALAGDRDPRVAPGLAALEGDTWDAVIDTSGYVPRVVGASATLLASRVCRYVFVSSLSVIAKPDRPGLDESAPVAALDKQELYYVRVRSDVSLGGVNSWFARMTGEAEETPWVQSSLLTPVRSQ